MKFTSENINHLESNEIIIFGSNKSGIHLAGLAKYCLDNFGAIYGQGEGLQGQCYAFPTKGYKIEKISINEIEKGIPKLIKCINENKDKVFYLTKVGTCLAGYTIEDIAPLFKDFINFENVVLPKDFYDIIINLKTE